MNFMRGVAFEMSFKFFLCGMSPGSASGVDSRPRFTPVCLLSSSSDWKSKRSSEFVDIVSKSKRSDDRRDTLSSSAFDIVFLAGAAFVLTIVELACSIKLVLINTCNLV